MTSSGSAGLSTIGTTALGVAAARARESARPDRLFDDPYAELFLRAAADSLPFRSSAWDPDALGPVSEIAEAFYLSVCLRTVFFDGVLTAAARGGARQIVLLAAGLDSRAFRLPWPDGVRLFEVDLPDMVDLKESVLRRHAAAARCARVPVAADLREDWPRLLASHGFQPELPTAWLAEGLFGYLTRAQAVGLLRSVTELSASGSRLSFEHNIDTGVASRAQSMAVLPDYAAIQREGLGDTGPGWLTQNGWQVQTYSGDTVAERWQRPPAKPGDGFLTATRS